MTELHHDALMTKKRKILNAVLKHVAFDGWSEEALRRGVHDAHLAQEMGAVLFPLGVHDVVALFIAEADRAMEEKAPSLHLSHHKIRDRIKLLIEARLDYHQTHKEVIPATLRYFSYPTNILFASKCLFHTSDLMWRLAGDNSTDFNYYTKRLLLANVYAATLLYFTGDESEGFQATSEFLTRRISDVMVIGGLKQRVTGWFTSHR